MTRRQKSCHAAPLPHQAHVTDMTEQSYACVICSHRNFRSMCAKPLDMRLRCNAAEKCIISLPHQAWRQGSTCRMWPSEDATSKPTPTPESFLKAPKGSAKRNAKKGKVQRQRQADDKLEKCIQTMKMQKQHSGLDSILKRTQTNLKRTRLRPVQHLTHTSNALVAPTCAFFGGFVMF